MQIGLLASVSALALVGYSGLVIYHGHLIALFAQLKQDAAFLSWMAAAGVLYWLSGLDEIGPPVRVITGVAIMAFLLKVFNGQGGAASATTMFGQGISSLPTAFEEFAIGAGVALGLYKAPNAVNNMPSPLGANSP